MVRVHDVKSMKAVVEVADEIAKARFEPRLPSLAPRAVVCSALDHGNFADRRAAHGARLSLASVGLVLKLKPAASPGHRRNLKSTIRRA